MTTRARTLSRLLAAALAVPALSLVSACEFTWTEGICMDDEVWIDHAAGGGDCRPQLDSDPDCPEGEIPRDRQPSGKLDCVPNDIEAEPYSG